MLIEQSLDTKPVLQMHPRNSWHLPFPVHSLGQISSTFKESISLVQFLDK